MKYVCVIFLLIADTAFAGGNLSPDIRISSAALGYDLQYRVYVPEEIETADELPVLFITDGPGYIQRGQVPMVLNRLLGSEKITPVVVVFVDSRDPDDLRVNRRNDEFFCNTNYLKFYTDELIPTIERTFPVQRSRESRTILGVSFGGLNAACFGLLGYETFSGVGMHSPANHPVEGLLPAYEEAPKLPLKFFLSTGYPNDNSADNRKFRRLLKNKGYEIKYIQKNAGHNWENWRPLIDDVLLYFYRRSPPEKRNPS